MNFVKDNHDMLYVRAISLYVLAELLGDSGVSFYICFMGHGTEADSNAVYAKMQQLLAERDFPSGVALQ